jgi:hypothetical protein
LWFHSVCCGFTWSCRVLACGNENKLHLWDRRTGKLPSLSLQAPVGAGDLNSLDLSNDEQVRKNSDVHHLALRSYANWLAMSLEC